MYVSLLYRKKGFGRNVYRMLVRDISGFVTVAARKGVGVKRLKFNPRL